ncbi:MAG: glycosyl transferase [Oscillospiraceae bacterium]|nr:glycosyl transferase [Oscillospiraceae bacterium]
MIFVAVGTQKFQLNRLLILIDNLIENKIITDEVFAQIGNCDYIPKNYGYTDFLDKSSFDEYIKKCRLLITHSGVGTIISGINSRKPVIVFPRLKKYNEHVDDHQLEIAQSFTEQNYVLMCGENDSLEKIIEQSRTHKFDRYVSQRKNMISRIDKFLQSI